MILSQLLEAEELKQITPERLRELLLRLDEEIKSASASGEKILFSIEANIIGVKEDRPAGANPEIVHTRAADRLKNLGARKPG